MQSSLPIPQRRNSRDLRYYGMGNSSHRRRSALRRSHSQEGVPYRLCLEPYTFYLKKSNDSIKKNNHRYSYDKRDDFNFPIVNFPFMCSNIPAAPAYGVYISELIR